MSLAPPAEPILRDIHVPDPSWWPPAPGWWALGSLLLLLLAVLLWWWRRRSQQRRKLRALDAEMRSITLQFEQDHDKVALASALSQLVRRATLLRGGKAQLRGQAWLAELERLAPSCIHQQNVAVLESAPYQRQASFDAQALIRDCRCWLQAAVERSDA